MTAILLSGGMDSTTLLWWLKARQQGPIHALSIDYGQRHRVELECAVRLAYRAEVSAHETLALDLAVLGGNPLTDPHAGCARPLSPNANATPSFPFRNMLFATLAAAYLRHKGHLRPVHGTGQRRLRGLPRLPSPLLRQPLTEPALGGGRRRAVGDSHALCRAVEAGCRGPSGSNSAFPYGETPHLL